MNSAIPADRSALDSNRTGRTLGCLAVFVLVPSGNPVWAAEGCARWNTESFFRTSQLDDVRACAAAGASLEQRDKQEQTPVHWAPRVGRVAQITALLEMGASGMARDEDGATPLHAAVRGQNAATQKSGASRCFAGEVRRSQFGKPRRRVYVMIQSCLRFTGACTCSRSCSSVSMWAIANSRMNARISKAKIQQSSLTLSPRI